MDTELTLHRLDHSGLRDPCLFYKYSGMPYSDFFGLPSGYNNITPSTELWTYTPNICSIVKSDINSQNGVLVVSGIGNISFTDYPEPGMFFADISLSFPNQSGYQFIVNGLAFSGDDVGYNVTSTTNEIINIGNSVTLQFAQLDNFTSRICLNGNRYFYNEPLSTKFDLTTLANHLSGVVINSVVYYKPTIPNRYNNNFAYSGRSRNTTNMQCGDIILPPCNGFCDTKPPDILQVEIQGVEPVYYTEYGSGCGRLTSNPLCELSNGTHLIPLTDCRSSGTCDKSIIEGVIPASGMSPAIPYGINVYFDNIFNYDNRFANHRFLSISTQGGVNFYKRYAAFYSYVESYGQRNVLPTFSIVGDKLWISPYRVITSDHSFCSVNSGLLVDGIAQAIQSGYIWSGIGWMPYYTPFKSVYLSNPNYSGDNYHIGTIYVDSLLCHGSWSFGGGYSQWYKECAVPSYAHLSTFFSIIPTPITSGFWTLRGETYNRTGGWLDNNESYIHISGAQFYTDTDVFYDKIGIVDTYALGSGVSNGNYYLTYNRDGNLQLGTSLNEDESAYMVNVTVADGASLSHYAHRLITYDINNFKYVGPTGLSRIEVNLCNNKLQHVSNSGDIFIFDNRNRVTHNFKSKVSSVSSLPSNGKYKHHYYYSNAYQQLNLYAWEDANITPTTLPYPSDEVLLLATTENINGSAILVSDDRPVTDNDNLVGVVSGFPSWEDHYDGWSYDPTINTFRLVDITGIKSDNTVNFRVDYNQIANDVDGRGLWYYKYYVSGICYTENSLPKDFAMPNVTGDYIVYHDFNGSMKVCRSGQFPVGVFPLAKFSWSWGRNVSRNLSTYTGLNGSYQSLRCEDLNGLELTSTNDRPSCNICYSGVLPYPFGSGGWQDYCADYPCKTNNATCQITTIYL